MRVGSATAAADALHITQPAVSRLIAELERQVGLVLFDRKARGLQPTKDALLLYEEVTRSFRALDRIAETAEAIRSRRTGHLRVIALHTYSDGIVAHALGRFLAKHPGVRVELESGSTADVVEGVMTDSFDVGIAPLPINEAAVKTALILAHEAVCIAPASHRFKGLRKINATELEGLPFLAPPLGSPFRAFIDRYLAGVGVKVTIVGEARTQRALCRLVASGAGVAIVDPTLAEEIARDQLRVVRLQPSLVWSIGALTSRRRSPPHALQALLSEFAVKSRIRA